MRINTLPVKRVGIPKASGGTRPLGIPGILDRLMQQAICQILMPIFDPEFSVSSYGYRPKRSAKGASEDLARKLQFGPYGWVVEADIRGFTFRWSKNSKGNPQVWRQTAKDRFRRALRRLKEWLRKARNLPMKELVKTLKSKYRGHRNYYGVVGNKNLLDSFVFFAHGIVFKWLNRRSQRRSYT